MQASRSNMPRLAVVAGVIRDGAGRVLLAQRPPGHHHAGLWEFPGGKRELGETAEFALRRELNEELGIQAGELKPLIRVPFDYPQRSIELDTYELESFSGEPSAREHSALCWRLPADIPLDQLPAADRPIAAALRLPERMAITPAELLDEAALMSGIQRLAASGFKLIQLRCPGWPPNRQRVLAAELLARQPELGRRLLLNADVVGARQLRCGLHLRSKQLKHLAGRPVGSEQWLSASCHSADDLDEAARIGVDAVLLGSVQASASHPGLAGMGWAAFADVRARSALPVYAIGGLQPDDLAVARCNGAQGIAAIRGFWSTPAA